MLSPSEIFRCFFAIFQALSHQTLVMLLGTDPSKHPDQPIPSKFPIVTFAYMKHMYKSGQKVAQWKFICSKATVETPKQYVKSYKINSKDSRTT